MPIEWVVPAVALLLLIWLATAHRRLIALRDVAMQAWAEVDDGFRRRHDLVSRLVEKTEGHLDKRDRSVQALVDARKAAATASTLAALGKAEVTLNMAIEKVLASAGSRPELLDDAGFRRLRSELPEMERRLEALRRDFNEVVEDYNRARAGFPAGLLTYVVNLPPLEPLPMPKAAEPEARRAVQYL